MTILNCLIVYDCASEEEAIVVLDKVLMKLQHANYAVVLASIRVLLSKLGYVKVSSMVQACVGYDSAW